MSEINIDNIESYESYDSMNQHPDVILLLDFYRETGPKNFISPTKGESKCQFCPLELFYTIRVNGRNCCPNCFIEKFCTIIHEGNGIAIINNRNSEVLYSPIPDRYKQVEVAHIEDIYDLEMIES